MTASSLTAKTSGSKGLQLYGAVADHGWAADGTNGYAHELARGSRRNDPELVVSRMAKSLRAGRVFIDWSQNNPSKTTVSPYSLRALDHPSVSTPLTWDEVEEGAEHGGETPRVDPTRRSRPGRRHGRSLRVTGLVNHVELRLPVTRRAGGTSLRD